MPFIKKLFGACLGRNSGKRKHPIYQECFMQDMTTDKKFDDVRMHRYPLLSDRRLPVVTPVTKEMVKQQLVPGTVYIIPPTQRSHAHPEGNDDKAKEHRVQTRKDYLTVVRNRKHYTEAEQLLEVYAEALDRRDIYDVGAWCWVRANSE